MYNILKYFTKGSQVTNIAIFDSVKDRKPKNIIPTEGLSTKFLNTTIEFPIESYNKEWDSYYQNLVIKGGKLKTELVIYQDYGDNSGVAPENFVELPRKLLFDENDPSIGWYDGSVCYIDPYKHYLVIIKLFKLKKLEFLKGLKRSSKRPYDFKLLTSKKYSLNSKVCYWLDLGEDNNGIFYGNDEMILRELINADALNFVFSLEKRMETKIDDVIPTRDWLVMNEFSYDASSKIWTHSKTGLQLKETGLEPYNNYFKQVGTDEFLFDINDIERLIKKYKNNN